MPTPRLRRRGLQPTRRRALELLASCPDGATDTLLMATHGLTTEMLVDLIRDGLATGRHCWAYEGNHAGVDYRGGTAGAREAMIGLILIQVS
jgi:hypothetical protein